MSIPRWGVTVLGHMRHLIAFIETANSGSFAAAALKTGHTASALSKSVAVLEADLATRLFRRGRRGVELTDEGQVFLVKCQQITALYDQALTEARSPRRALRGRLRVMFYHAPGRNYLAPALPRFMAKHPMIELQCSIVDGYYDLEEIGADVAILTGQPPQVPGLISKRLFFGQMVTCASPRYIQQFGAPEQPLDLQVHRNLVLVRPDGSLGNQWRFYKNDEHQFVTVDPYIALNDVTSLSRMAITGAGLVHFPLIGVSPHLTEGTLKRVLSDWYSPYLPVNLLISPGRHKDPIVRAFVSFVEQVVRQEIPAQPQPSWFREEKLPPMVRLKSRPIFPSQWHKHS